MLLRLLVSLGLYLLAESCSPPREWSHPQKQFCQAENVVMIKVLRQNKNNEILPLDYKYKVRIEHIFKGKANIDQLNNTEIISTLGPLHSCGPMPLQIKARYILQVNINKGFMSASIFGIHKKVKNKDLFMKRIELFDCNCKIKTMPDVLGRIPKGKDICPQSHVCKLNGYCAKKANGRCDWSCFNLAN